MYKEIILSKILDYVRLRKIPHAGAKSLSFHCPFCDTPGVSANVVPNTSKIACYKCGKAGSPRYYNLIDLARKIENVPDSSDEEVLTLLRNLLNLTVTTQKDENEISTYLDKYSKNGWCLVPCAKASGPTATEKIFTGKEPIQKEWQNKQNRDKSEWFHWINSSLNIGVRTGAVSNLCVIDIDILTKEEKVALAKETTNTNTKKSILAKKVIPQKIQAVMGETLIQETHGGFQLFYQACDLPKGVADIDGVHIDIETEGGQVVIFPSFQTAVCEEYKEGDVQKKRIVGYVKRKWLNDLPIAKIPDALYQLLKTDKIKEPELPEETKAEQEIIDAIKNEQVKVELNDFTNNRTNTLIKFGGILRKSLNVSQVRQAVSLFNNMVFPEPLPKDEVSHVIESLDKYIDDTSIQMKNTILDFLGHTDIASKTDIELAIFGKRAESENKIRMEKVLTDLLMQHKICKYGMRNYKLVKVMPINRGVLNVGTPINFKMPYFHDYAHFNKGDLILIGARTKIGKTTLAMNIIKRLAEQKLDPTYLYNETGGRFGKTAIRLGLTKDEDFGYARATNPEEIILAPNKVYVYDWIRPTDFARTADIFDSIVQKLEETQSVMIGFVQLRDNGDWFAKDLVRQFVSLSVKYLYTDKDGVINKFELDDVRDRKTGGKSYIIPCKYVEETREVKTQDEIDEEERKIQNDTPNEGHGTNKEGTGIGTNTEADRPNAEVH